MITTSRLSPQRENLFDVQVLAVIARFRNHAAGEAEPEAGFEVGGIDLVACRLDAFDKLLCRSEQTRGAAIDVDVERQPLASLAIHLADIDQPGKDRLAVIG